MIVRWSNKVSLVHISPQPEFGIYPRKYVLLWNLWDSSTTLHRSKGSPTQAAPNSPRSGSLIKAMTEKITYGWESLCGSPGFQCRCSITGGKSRILECTRRKLWYYLCLPLTRWHSSVPQKLGLRRSHRIYVLTVSQTPLDAGPWATKMPHPRSPKLVFPLPSPLCSACLICTHPTAILWLAPSAHSQRLREL